MLTIQIPKTHHPAQPSLPLLTSSARHSPSTVKPVSQGHYAIYQSLVSVPAGVSEKMLVWGKWITATRLIRLPRECWNQAKPLQDMTCSKTLFVAHNRSGTSFLQRVNSLFVQCFSKGVHTVHATTPSYLVLNLFFPDICSAITLTFSPPV